MAKARRGNEVRLLGFVRRKRHALMTSTALQATVMLVLALPVDAQPAPNARPIGGTIVAGAAAISRTSGDTAINQSTQRAAVNWKSFDVGSRQSVTFHQPTASSVTLNRVTGPDPSQIAGRIDANGQIVLVNQSGVTFYKGAQVNANGLMVTAADISNRNFMAGVMKFSQPGSPNARIENRGSITIKEAGLAALVAPQVANSGVINAKLGHVVLAGAKTATLDLYGDGLLSLDVTNQVTQIPRDKAGHATTALVTNTGVIIADGGTVQLTARAADGIVENLVQAGGSIRAASDGNRTGVVALNGVGGSIVVEGQLSAPGSAPGTKGGGIEVVANGNVVVASAAKINASGKSGGGTVAIGTTLDRARGGPSVTAKNVTVQSGATIAIDASDGGEGGRSTLLSTDTTHLNGAITAKGGVKGGNGGLVEVSGTDLGMTGSIDLSAPKGKPGTLLLDPDFLTITLAPPPGSLDGNFSGTVPFGVDPGGADTISSNVLNGFGGNVVLQAAKALTVAASFSLTNGDGLQTLTMEAGGTLTVNAGVSVTASGNIILATGGAGPAAPIPAPPPAQPSPLISVLGSVNSSNGSVSLLTGAAGKISIGAAGSVTAGAVILNAGTGGIELLGKAVLGQVGSLIDVTSGGPVRQATTSTIIADTMTSSAGVSGNVSLLGTANAIDRLRNFAVGGGDLVLVDGNDLTLTGAVKANDLFLEVAKAGGTLTFGDPPNAEELAPEATVSALANGRISLVADNYIVANSGSSIATTAGTVELAPFSSINTSLLGSRGLVVGPTLLPIIHTDGGTLEVGGFTNVPAGATGPAASASSVSVDNAADLTGLAATLRLDATGSITEPGGPLTVAALMGAAGTSANLTQSTNMIGTLGTFSTKDGFALVDNQALLVSGPVTDTGTASTLALTTKTGGITFAGSVNAANTVALTSAGAINQSSGTLSAGTLTGSATGAANLTGSNQVTTLGTFSADSFALTDGVDLLIGGTLNAARIAVRAPTNQISLGDGATIVTSGSVRPPGAIQPLLEPGDSAAPGALFQAAGFTQIGSSSVVGQGGGPATVRIDVTGNLQFDPPLGLQGTGTWLILNLTNGTAAGDVFVNALDVSYTTPGGANLRGAIQGISDGTAAVRGSIQPAINVNYLFNGCIIAATVCQPTPTPAPAPAPQPPPLPPPAPTLLRLTDVALTSALGGLYHPFLPGAPPAVIDLQRLVLVALPMLPAARRQLTDPDVVPPNISYLDY